MVRQKGFVGMTLTLVIGNRNYSSWSMRPWLAMRACNITFEGEYGRYSSFGDSLVRIVRPTAEERRRFDVA